MTDRPATGIESLVLDAAPLLVQARIAGLADKYYIPASVVAELRDARARDYLHTLHTTGQIDLEVREPGAEALKMVMEFAKQTGDYAVLSKPDLHVLALTYALEVEAHGTWRIRQTVGGKTGQQLHEERRLEEKRVAQPQGQGAKDAIQQGGRAEAQNDVHQGGQEAEDGFTLVTKRAPRYHATDARMTSALENGLRRTISYSTKTRPWASSPRNRPWKRRKRPAVDVAEKARRLA